STRPLHRSESHPRQGPEREIIRPSSPQAEAGATNIHRTRAKRGCKLNTRATLRARFGGSVAMGVWLAIRVVSLAFVFGLVDGDSGLRTWLALRDDLHAAQTRIERLKGNVAELEDEGGGLAGAGEPFALERAIRERLVYARDGETLVRLDPPGDTSPRIP